MMVCPLFGMFLVAPWGVSYTVDNVLHELLTGDRLTERRVP